ncbi:MAG: hypothetical protein KDC98_07560 [Planctomycetes bacterium]|nr:hypothetical protein [Planctomycetota bacterium]
MDMRRKDEFDERLTLTIVVMIVVILLMVTMLSNTGKGGPPVKITSLGQLQPSQGPVSKRLRAWYGRVLDTEGPNQFIVGTSDGQTITEFNNPAFASRPEFLAASDNGSNLLFTVPIAGGWHSLHRIDQYGNYKQIKVQDSKDIHVLATAADDSKAYVLAHNDKDIAVYGCAWDEEEATVEAGSSVTAASVPTTASFVLLQDGFAYDHAASGGTNVLRVRGATPTSYPVSTPVDLLHAIKDQLHAVAGPDKALFWLGAAGVEPVKANAAAAVDTAAAAAGAITKVDQVATVDTDLLVRAANQVYRVSAAAATQLPFAPASDTVSEVTGNSYAWALASIGADTFLWKGVPNVFIQFTDKFGDAPRLLTAFGDGVVLAAGTSTLHRYGPFGNPIAKHELPDTHIRALWATSDAIYALVEDTSQNPPPTDLYIWR